VLGLHGLGDDELQVAAEGREIDLVPKPLGEGVRGAGRVAPRS
jgi:hypothetical protein